MQRILVAVFGLCFVGQMYADWGSVKVEKVAGRWEITLENSLIKVKYHKALWGCDCIGTFVDKTTNKNVAQGLDYRYNPDDANFQIIGNAKIEEDNDVRKRVLIQFSGRWQYVSIYEDRPYLEVQHVHAGHIQDVAPAECHTFVVYGAEEWANYRKWSSPFPVTSGSIPDKFSYYSMWEQNTYAPLDYKGHFIFGMIQASEGYGFGNVSPWIFSEGQGKVGWWSLVNNGYERWMEWGQTKHGHIEYYFPVNGGEAQFLSLGKRIADMASGGEWNAGVGTVNIKPNGGAFPESVKVTLESSKAGLPIHYTTDGQIPTRQSIKYTAPFVLTQTATVKARAYAVGYTDSSGIASALFKVYPNLMPKDPGATTAGLEYSYYEGSWKALPDFDGLTPKSKGTVLKFDLSPAERTVNFGLVFEGYIAITKAGTYSFYLDSDAGSRLYIDSHLIVDNDGSGGLVKDSGKVVLHQGKYPIRVDYYNEIDTRFLTVRYRPPDEYRQLIPDSVLSYGGSGGPGVLVPAIKSQRNPQAVAVSAQIFGIDGRLLGKWSGGSNAALGRPQRRWLSGIYFVIEKSPRGPRAGTVLVIR